MNERIKLLAEQARRYAWENETHWSANAEREALFEQKFAELIVLECAMIAREIGNNTEPDDFALDRCYEIEDKIKEHFGVK